jgi:polyribonucleotide nucleotidyltransferase
VLRRHPSLLVPYGSVLRSNFHKCNQLNAINPFNKVFGECVEVESSSLSFSKIETIAIGGFSLGNSVCRYGGTVVHTTVNVQNIDGDINDTGMPLTVDYRYRSYSAGLMSMNKNRRDRHGNEDEIIASRIIDRSVRPLFAKGFLKEIQIISTAHTVDEIHDPIIASVNSTSMALMQSGLPWAGPIGCVRVGLIDDALVVNPSLKDMERSTLDLVYSGTADRVLM